MIQVVYACSRNNRLDHIVDRDLMAYAADHRLIQYIDNRINLINKSCPMKSLILTF